MSEAVSEGVGKVSGDVTRVLALTIYQRMGRARSIVGVVEELKRQGYDPPCARTIERWAASGAWSDKIARYNAEVGEGVQQGVTEQAVTEALTAAAELRGFAMDGLEHLKDKLKGVDIETPDALKTLTGAIIDALAAARIESGGVSDRQGMVTTTPDDQQAYADDLKARFAHLGPKADEPETGVPASPPVKTTSAVDKAVVHDAPRPIDYFPDDGDREPITH